MDEMYEYILSEFKKSGNYDASLEHDIFWAPLDRWGEYCPMITGSMMDIVEQLTTLSTNEDIAEFINNKTKQTKIGPFMYDNILFSGVVFSYVIPNELRRGYND